LKWQQLDDIIATRKIVESGDEAREIERLYYSITEVSEMLGIEPHVLRFWETQFKQIRLARDAGGRRRYRRADIEKIKLVRKLLREDGYTIKGAKERLALIEKGDDDPRSVKDFLRLLSEVDSELESILTRLGSG
jgi:DNA-binding transcriptional MerR regulator